MPATRLALRSSSIVLAFSALGVALVLALAGCSGSSGPAAGSSGSGSGPASGGTIAVVASTNVYGDIASAIGGNAVSVTSIIDDPDRDPHEYQADAQNQLALSKAAVIIENGGGYDDFVDTMLSSADNSSAEVLNAADISGYDLAPADGEFNEHLWYDFPTVQKVVEKLASTLSTLDPANASTFSSNAAAFTDRLTALEATEATMKTSFGGQGAAITEPVPLYMLDAIGLVNKTPEPFSEAIENGTDVAPDVLAETVALFASGEVKVLAYNSQTSGAQTDGVLAAAEAAGVAAVPVTETLPAGKTYLEWMTDTLAALQTALAP